MAAKKTDTFDEMMIIEEKKEETEKVPTARIFLPKLEDPGDAGIKVDQYEHVTIANEEKEKTWYIHRGEWVDVPWYVYQVLKAKYPDL
jgi:hypothetical protein